jgi:hypothetical protein
MMIWSRTAGIAVYAGMLAASIGCGDGLGGSYGAPSSPPTEAPDEGEGGAGGGAGGGRGFAATRCRDGETRPGEEVIGGHGGIVNCFTGVNRCVSGRWSEACTPEVSPAL